MPFFALTSGSSRIERTDGRHGRLSQSRSKCCDVWVDVLFSFGRADLYILYELINTRVLKN